MGHKVKYVWKQVPLFRVIWPFIAGIILGIFLPNLSAMFGAVILLILTSLLMPFIRRTKHAAAVFFLAAFIVAGYAITCLHTDRLYDNHYSHQAGNSEGHWIARVVSDPIPRAKSIKAEVQLKQVRSAVDTAFVSGKILAYFQKSEAAHNLRLGDELALAGRLNQITPPQNPNEFNYKRYMHFHQISHQLYVPDDRWATIATGSGVLREIRSWQHAVIDIIEKHRINERELAIVSALLVGYKHYLSSDQVNAFASAGAMHVLAVSGLHVGIVFLIVSSLLKPLERIRRGKVIKGALLLVVLWGYALLTGLSPSVTRAATMFSFVIASQQFGRHTDIYNTLATSAVALLVLNPFLVVEVGFQLSYLAVLGIVVLQPHIYQLWETKWWLPDKIWAITSVSIAAQVATFPLGLLYFHQFPNYFLISNLVVIPLATFIIPVGIALVSLSWMPVLADALGTVLYYMVHFLDLFIQWVDALPGALLEGIDISIFETYFIYMVILTSTLFLIGKSYRWLMAFLFTFCVIETFNIFEAYQQRLQSAFLVYKVKGHEAMNVIKGRQHQFYSSAALVGNFDKMRFHIHHHWWHRDLTPPALSEWNGGLYYHNDHVILCLNDTLRVDSTVGKVDVLHISQRTADHPKFILDNLTPDVVVLSQNLDWKTRSYWMYLLEKRKQAFHDMREEGAFVISEDT